MTHSHLNALTITW